MLYEQALGLATSFYWFDPPRKKKDKENVAEFMCFSSAASGAFQLIKNGHVTSPLLHL